MNGKLRCRQVSLVFTNGAGQEKTVLRSVDAVFAAGAVSVVSGANAAGKSTLLHLLGGILRPTSGEVIWDGQPVSRWTAHHRDRWRRRVGIAFQKVYLMEDLTALENVMVPLIPRGIPVREMKRRCMGALEQSGAADLAPEPVRSLSGGQRQRICIARAVVGDPEVLLADEPAAHQDPEGARQIKSLLLDAAGRGATVIVAAPSGDRLFSGDEQTRRLALEHGALRTSP
ncbi:MAG: ATP-binding cassette domain-containing protein [Desulfobacterales bacterium]